MKSHWRRLASLLPLAWEKNIYRFHFKSLHNGWVKAGKSLPPSHLSKQELIREYAKTDNLSVLIETGTYLGDMVFAMQDQFRQIYSIELSHHFYEKAILRFKNFGNIKIIEGDSGQVIKLLLPEITGAALFWLDGHYSGGKTAKGDKECPIYEELSTILTSPFNHTIIIDDARLFVGKNDYPTIEEVKSYILRIKPDSRFTFKNDAIIITCN